MGIPVPSEDLPKTPPKTMDEEYRLPAGGIDKLFSLEEKHNLPKGLLLATITNETGTQPDRANALNKDSGAQGWMQFRPPIAKAYNVDTTNFDSSVEGAAKMFVDLKKQYKGDVKHMLAGYNWGSGNISEQGIENMPKETKRYISSAEKIMEKVKGFIKKSPSKKVPESDLPVLPSSFPSDEELNKMNEQDIFALRNKQENIGNPEVSKKLAPFEHKQFWKEWVYNHPATAIPSAMLIPIYQGLKKMGVNMRVTDNPQTSADWKQLTEAEKGVFEGFMNYFSERE